RCGRIGKRVQVPHGPATVMLRSSLSVREMAQQALELSQETCPKSVCAQLFDGRSRRGKRGRKASARLALRCPPIEQRLLCCCSAAPLNRWPQLETIRVRHG